MKNLHRSFFPVFLGLLLFFKPAIALNEFVVRDSVRINLLILDKQNDARLEGVKVSYTSLETGEKISTTSNEKGEGFINIATGVNYAVDVGVLSNVDEIKFPESADASYNFLYYYRKEKKEALLKLYLHNNLNQPLIENVEIENPETGETYNLRTNEQGKAEVRLPAGAFYEVNLTNAPHYEDFEIPPVDNYKLHFDITFNGSRIDSLFATKEKALLRFRYRNPQKEGLPDEQLFVRSEKTNRTYTAKTNKHGLAELLVPIGDVYHYSVKHWEDFGIDTIPADPMRHLRELNLTFISSREFEKREKAREQLAKMRDAKAIFNPEEVVEHYLEKSREIVDSSVFEIQAGLEEDSLYFEKNNFNINSVLYRLRNKWKKKLIVTDVTGSMEPYLIELLQWHTLKLMADEENQYIFFNDGDGKPDSSKIIGETGGFHYTRNDNLDSLLTALFNARKYGCGGDSPENDIEALLESKAYMKGRWELILVADNYSPVSDMELLRELDVPVHIILCGPDIYPHEHYLKIAKETGGSIHTIKDDLLNLAGRRAENNHWRPQLPLYQRTFCFDG